MHFYFTLISFINYINFFHFDYLIDTLLDQEWLVFQKGEECDEYTHTPPPKFICIYLNDVALVT